MQFRVNITNPAHSDVRSPSASARELTPLHEWFQSLPNTILRDSNSPAHFRGNSLEQEEQQQHSRTLSDRESTASHPPPIPQINPLRAWMFARHNPASARPPSPHSSSALQPRHHVHPAPPKIPPQELEESSSPRVPAITLPRPPNTAQQPGPAQPQEEEESSPPPSPRNTRSPPVPRPQEQEESSPNRSSLTPFRRKPSSRPLIIQRVPQPNATPGPSRSQHIPSTVVPGSSSHPAPPTSNTDVPHIDLLSLSRTRNRSTTPFDPRPTKRARTGVVLSPHHPSES
ncbi:hypothetical protein L226DRAFT_576991 [Lentinus tigrinus ALCF2SS1-7]|uniref:uncharacterized protein n=1 Tax=Lentinus tigrinus ALCF2SS1-7 TaxID=1328758 RepID=UPI001165D709|nr:hypothetical protein L226DRAFT_576991 [Lentinus tigrinus ALCF2SS1-7]